jgi:hypothetical protein
MNEGVCLETTIAEYEGLMRVGRSEDVTQFGDDQIAARLTASFGWTDRGADAIVGLVRDYGAFMLRNALALAIVLGEEDGRLGF